ncbi:MAG: hypothetical protein JNL58_23380 [Planctomyces sp.]|nr:hypothetical protein [Planctomyces sp.]
MARKRNSTTISLFPFLAVLMCTMGALILLLLVTTRKIRNDQQKQVPIFVESPAVIVPSQPPEPVVINRDEEIAKLNEVIARLQGEIDADSAKLAVLRSDVEAKQGTLTATTIELSNLESEIKVLEDRKASLTVAPVLKEATDLTQQHETLLVKLSEATERLIRKQQELATTTDQIAARAIELKQRQSALIALRRQVAAAENAPATGTKTLVEFSNPTGTTRTPIVIDVSDAGYEFLPTGVRITSRDMQGFPVNDNPLLSGVLTLHRQRSGGSVVSEPYVLLLVRPDGCLPFYGAQKILSEAKIHFGYELLTPDRQIDVGQPDQEEIRVVRQSLLESLNRRQSLYAVLHRKAIEEMDAKLAEQNGEDGSSKRLTVRADGRLESSEELDGRRPMEGRFFAGGVVPPRNKPSSRDYQEMAKAIAQRRAQEIAALEKQVTDPSQAGLPQSGFEQFENPEQQTGIGQSPGFGDPRGNEQFSGAGSAGGQDAGNGNSEFGFAGNSPLPLAGITQRPRGIGSSDGTVSGQSRGSSTQPGEPSEFDPSSGASAGSDEWTPPQFAQPERTAAGGSSPNWLSPSSSSADRSPSGEPSPVLTPAEAALMSGPTSGQRTGQSSLLGQGSAAAQGASGGQGGPDSGAGGGPSSGFPGADEPNRPAGGQRDLSMLDPDLRKLLDAKRRNSQDDSTPVGITVFLDEQHLTIGQNEAVFLSPETSNEALATLLTGISEEVALSRRKPREPLLPIVKFVVSPGGEKWRIQFAKELRSVGIPSAQVYQLEPYIVPLDDTGRATIPMTEGELRSEAEPSYEPAAWPGDEPVTEGANP